jgi:hypothetical protein
MGLPFLQRRDEVFDRRQHVVERIDISRDGRIADAAFEPVGDDLVDTIPFLRLQLNALEAQVKSLQSELKALQHEKAVLAQLDADAEEEAVVTMLLL